VLARILGPAPLYPSPLENRAPDLVRYAYSLHNQGVSYLLRNLT
jgi:hypothetical protein